MDRLKAVELAANLAQFEHLMCRLEDVGHTWTAQVLAVTGERLYSIDTDEEADLYIENLWDLEEEEEEF